MAVGGFTADDYAGALTGLLPPGRALQAPQGSDLQTLIKAYAQTFARLDTAAQGLRADAFPATTTQLLSEWESSVGLPDKFEGDSPTALRRRQQMLSRFTGNSCLRAIDIVNMAAILGYDVGCLVYRPATVDETVADEPLYGDEWAFAIAIVSNQTTYAEALADISHADEPLAYWGNDVLEGVIRQALPAWYAPIFIYVDGNPVVTAQGFCLVDDAGEIVTA